MKPVVWGVLSTARIGWRMTEKKHHVGMIVRSPDPGRVQQLLNSYVDRRRQDFLAWQPPLDRPNF